MTTTLAIPNDYGYVLLAAASTALVNWAHIGSTIAHRTAAKVPYPIAYVSAADAATNESKHLFNCAQRAHANFLENQPSFLVSMLVSGLRWPRVSAVMGAVWVTGRALYLVGYTRRGLKYGKGRYWGIQWQAAQLAVTVTAFVAAWGVVVGR